MNSESIFFKHVQLAMLLRRPGVLMTYLLKLSPLKDFQLFSALLSRFCNQKALGPPLKTK